VRGSEYRGVLRNVTRRDQVVPENEQFFCHLDSVHEGSGDGLRVAEPGGRTSHMLHRVRPPFRSGATDGVNALKDGDRALRRGLGGITRGRPLASTPSDMDRCRLPGVAAFRLNASYVIRPVLRTRLKPQSEDDLPLCGHGSLSSSCTGVFAQ
jgi:hypothetical protein